MEIYDAVLTDNGWGFELAPNQNGELHCKTTFFVLCDLEDEGNVKRMMRIEHGDFFILSAKLIMNQVRSNCSI